MQSFAILQPAMRLS